MTATAHKNRVRCLKSIKVTTTPAVALNVPYVFGMAVQATRIGVLSNITEKLGGK